MTRRIYFYTTRFEKKTPAGRRDRVQPRPVFQHVNGLPFSDMPAGRYLPYPDGNALCMRIDRMNLEVLGQLGVTRVSGLPRIDRRGNMRSLSLAHDEGLYEPSHFVLFRNGILGFERNFYGPTSGRFESYLETIANTLADRVTLAVVPRRGALDRLRRISYVRSITLRVARDIVQRTDMLNRNLRDMFEAGRRASDAEEVAVILTASKYSRTYFLLPWLRRVPDYLADSAARDGTSEFIVKGQDEETGSMTEVDLLSDIVVSKKTVPLTSSRERSVVSTRMYDAIREAYQESEADLRRVANA